MPKKYKYPRWHPSKCQRCGDDPEPGGRISAKGLCTRCSVMAMTAAIIALQTKHGDIYTRYQRALLRSSTREIEKHLPPDRHLEEKSEQMPKFD